MGRRYRGVKALGVMILLAWLLYTPITNWLKIDNQIYIQIVINLMTWIEVLIGTIARTDETKKQIESTEKNLKEQIEAERENQERRIPLEYLTEKRVDWLQDVRNISAEWMASVLATVNYGKKEEEFLNSLNKVNLLAGKLVLFLNPQDELDSIVISILGEVAKKLLEIEPVDVAQRKQVEELERYVQLGIIYIGVILKTEWYRINLEVKGLKDIENSKELKKLLFEKNLELLKNAKGFYKKEILEVASFCDIKFVISLIEKRCS